MSVIKEKRSKGEADVSGFHIFCSDKKNFDHPQRNQEVKQEIYKSVTCVQKKFFNTLKVTSAVPNKKSAVLRIFKIWPSYTGSTKASITGK